MLKAKTQTRSSSLFYQHTILVVKKKQDGVEENVLNVKKSVGVHTNSEHLLAYQFSKTTHFLG